MFLDPNVKKCQLDFNKAFDGKIISKQSPRAIITEREWKLGCKLHKYHICNNLICCFKNFGYFY